MKRILTLVIAMIFAIIPACAENKTASVEMSFSIPSYMQIESVLSPVLIANITDRTGNLYTPLHSKFRVITNTHKTKTLYLKANTITDAGLENAMFKQGGQVYIAFGNLAKIPKSQALANCKNGALPNASPGIVAYPVTSVSGAKHKFNKDKYEVYVENGETYVTIDIGSHILRSSFAPNDTNGFYQTILSLTEADI